LGKLRKPRQSRQPPAAFIAFVSRIDIPQPFIAVLRAVRASPDAGAGFRIYAEFEDGPFVRDDARRHVRSLEEYTKRRLGFVHVSHPQTAGYCRVDAP
jgi:hypothetical protein